MKKIKLFCIPYAGGSANIYLPWKSYIDNSIDIIPLELAGRGARFKDEFYNSIEEAADDLFLKIMNQINLNDNYMIYGHSMGALLLYEIIFKILENKKQLPLHLFLSGRYPPYIIKKNKMLHKLPDDDFIEEIKKYGGISSQILDHKEMLKIATEILKNDYRILETYIFNKADFRINQDITILGGTKDEEVTEENLEEWKKWTKGNGDIYIFDGGHFFIHDYPEQIVKIINNKVNNSLITIY